MNIKSNWPFLLAIFLALALVVLGGLGGYFYWRLNGENFELAQAKKELEDQIIVLEKSLATTTLAWREEQARTNSFATELSGLASTVGTLDKLSKTDRELLQKYSKVYFLNEHYVPSDLATVTPTYLYYPGNNLRVHAKIWPKLENLLLTASSSGITLQVNSAYRSYGTQAAIKSSYQVTYGSGSNKFSADQGYSEHQLGTTVDFGTPSIKGDFSKFGQTDAFAWLTANAYKYGFAMSYPKNNVYYVYEPWHWRYVGVALASRLHNENKYFYDLPQRTIDQYLVNIFD